MPNTPRKSKEWLFFPYLAGLKNSYPEILRRYESDAKKGINLNFKLTNAQGRQFEVANDRLRMCYLNDEWYSYPNPNDLQGWFPKVSYFKLLDNGILVCSDSPGCQGSQWTLFPGEYFSWNSPKLQAPKGTGIQIIAYKQAFPIK
jgi:hypothetical protein